MKTKQLITVTAKCPKCKKTKKYSSEEPPKYTPYIELWVHDYNIIATSKKFYGAFFEKDLKHANPDSK